MLELLNLFNAFSIISSSSLHSLHSHIHRQLEEAPSFFSSSSLRGKCRSAHSYFFSASEVLCDTVSRSSYSILAGVAVPLQYIPGVMYQPVGPPLFNAPPLMLPNVVYQHTAVHAPLSQIPIPMSDGEKPSGAESDHDLFDPVPQSVKVGIRTFISVGIYNEALSCNDMIYINLSTHLILYDISLSQNVRALCLQPFGHKFDSKMHSHTIHVVLYTICQGFSIMCL